MNIRDRGILYGMVIGDGNLYIATNNFGVKYTKLTIGHSPLQEEYLKHKISLLHSILGGKEPKIYSYQGKNKSTGKLYTNLQTVKTNKYFKQMHRVIYPLGVKVYTRQVLNYLTNHGLALWYCDDGSIKLSKDAHGKVKSFSVTISTYCSREEAEIIKLWFQETYKITPKFDVDKRNNKYSIRFNSKDSKTFIGVVRPYVPDSMKYKLGIFQECGTPQVGDDIVQPVIDEIITSSP